MSLIVTSRLRANRRSARFTPPAGRSPAPHLNECSAPIGFAHRLGSVLPAGPGPGRAVAHRDGGTGNRDQLRPFPQGRRLPAVPVPVRCRAGLLLLAALGADGRPPDRQGRDLPAPRARARVTVEVVNAPAKTCDIRHHPHLPPKLPDGPVPPGQGAQTSALHRYRVGTSHPRYNLSATQRMPPGMTRYRRDPIGL